jgi:hypothetical protein
MLMPPRGRPFLVAGALAFALALGIASPSAFAAPPASGSGSETPESDADRERRAGQLFGDGQTAFETGDFRRAATLFEQAYAAKPHHNVLWNAARSWQRAGEESLTANDLDRYLREAGEGAPHRDEATKTLADIMKRVGRVQIQRLRMKVVRIDGTPTSEPTVYVSPGEHVATGTNAAGDPVRKAFEVRAGETVSVILGEAEKTEKPPATPADEPERTKPLSPWFVVGGAILTAGAGGFAALFGLDTVDKANAFDRNMTQANLDAGHAAQDRTNIALGVTAGLAVVTIAVAALLVDWGGHKSTAPSSKTGASRGGSLR